MKKARILCLVTLSLAFLLAASVFGFDYDRSIIFDIPQKALMEQYGRLPGTLLSLDEIREITEATFDGDTVKLLIIPVEWDWRPHTYSRETLDSMIFSRDIFPGGSIADYFHEVSYGKISITGDVLDWFNATDYNIRYGDFGSVLTRVNPWVDFSKYDANGDRCVDGIVFLRSGTGQEDSGDPNDIWSYAMSTTREGSRHYDAVRIPRWCTSPELRPLRDPDFPFNFSGLTTLNRIRVMAHETAHVFGLDDLYDYDNKLDTTTYFTPDDYNDHPLVDWCLMGYGGYGILSLGSEKMPTHLCGWSKYQLGWVEPITLEGEYKDVVVYNIETHKDSSLYRVTIDESQGEYFLLEYRNPQSTSKFGKLDSDFSAYFWPDLTYGSDTLDRGLLITHVHDSLLLYTTWYINNGTPSFPHYTVAVEDAGYNPNRNMFTNPEGRLSDSAQWWYPYETRKGALFSDDVDGQNEFGPNTTPNSDGYYGPSGIYVRVDSIVGDRLYAYVNNPMAYAKGVSQLSSATTGHTPAQYSLSSNYPNPFNPSTEIRFTLPEAARVKLEVFNLIGQRVAVLVDGQLEAGSHTVTWDGRQAASGVYLYRLEAGDFVDSKKMMLIK